MTAKKPQGNQTPDPAMWEERVEAMARELVARDADDRTTFTHTAYFAEVTKPVGPFFIMALLYQLERRRDGSIVGEPERAVTLFRCRHTGPMLETTIFKDWPTVDEVWGVFSRLIEHARAEELGGGEDAPADDE
ncbi:hypothetical protein [Streptomyces sp. NPDC017941]|uniref:hypothetical protein n=1 Tax=Streptomyces sp. NPDC017941 TaxID=3365018 RepID=UPI0037A4FF7B